VEDIFGIEKFRARCLYQFRAGCINFCTIYANVQCMKLSFLSPSSTKDEYIENVDKVCKLNTVFASSIIEP